MRARAEPFGAWVRLDEPAALVAIDKPLARRLRVLPEDAWSPARLPSRPRPLEVHLAVTERCPVGCPGCYLDATPVGHQPTTEALCARLDAIDALGAFTVAFGGGEPLLRRDLDHLARHARARGLVPVLTTSGVGLGPARVDELLAFAQINVSYDGDDAVMLGSRGTDARAAERALALLVARGVRVGVNVVVSRHSFPSLAQTVAAAARLGASEVQLLRYKPAGRAVGLRYLADRLDNVQIAALPGLVASLVAHGGVPVRIDCALVPFVVSDAIAPGDLAAWGVFGCEAGRNLAIVRADGAVAGCSFASDAAPGPLDEDALAHAAVARFSAHADALPVPCASCAFRVACRGGCRVVADHAGRSGEADPECPRVVAFHERAGLDDPAQGGSSRAASRVSDEG